MKHSKHKFTPIEITSYKQLESLYHDLYLWRCLECKETTVKKNVGYKDGVECLKCGSRR